MAGGTWGVTRTGLETLMFNNRKPCQGENRQGKVGIFSILLSMFHTQHHLINNGYLGSEPRYTRAPSGLKRTSLGG